MINRGRVGEEATACKASSCEGSNCIYNKKRVSSCENSYCIYNKKGGCELETVRISTLGMCEECIIPDIDEETLERYKQAQLEKLAARALPLPTLP